VFLGLLKGHFLHLISTEVGSVFPWFSRKISVPDILILMRG